MADRSDIAIRKMELAWEMTRDFTPDRNAVTTNAQLIEAKKATLKMAKAAVDEVYPDPPSG